jgi:iron complex transport system substrate-binding protein
VRRLPLLAILSLLISGCAPAQNSENTELRVIAAAAGAAEILTEIGLDNSIVGVDERNAKASQAQVITSGHSFNFEQVIALNPNYVIIDSLTDSSEVRQQFKQSKIKIIELPTAENIDQIFDKYQILGKRFNKVKEAESASNALRAKFDEFKVSNRSFRIAFLYLRGTNAIYFVGGKGSGADSLIEAVGSVDVGATELNNPFSPLTAEVMRKINPEVLLLMKNGFESVGGLTGLRSLPGLSGTTAVKNGSIVLIDDRELLDFGPETIDVLGQIQDQLKALDGA